MAQFLAGPFRAWLVVALLVVFSNSALCQRELQEYHLNKDPGKTSDHAFVTLLYGEDFVLGVRVLGQSIRDTKTSSDLVLIVTGKISASSLKSLQSDGWRIRQVSEIANPAKGPQTSGFPAKFSSVYTKLSIFNLVEYKKIVYLDADTIMTRNSDALFNCPGFCATLRHSERLNSGVMVVTPSSDRYEDMMLKINLLPSYTGGDQGFLNAYFDDFMNGFVFNPNRSYEKTEYETMRLPTRFNADIGLYVLNSNRWMIPEDKISVVHFTLGPIKPWQWWSSWVIKDVARWDAIRLRLPKDSNGYSQGGTAGQQFFKACMGAIPFVALVVMSRRNAASRTPFKGSSSSLLNSPNYGGPTVSARSVIPKQFAGKSILVGYVTFLIPMGLTLWSIPVQIRGFWGWFIFNEWTLFGHGILFGLYLSVCYQWGNKTALSSHLREQGSLGPRPWRATIEASLAAVICLLMCPWVAELLHVQNFVTKVLLTSVCAVITNVILTHVYSSLSICWFACGRSEALVKSTEGP